MKKYSIIATWLFTLLACLASCGDNFDVSDKYDGVLSLSAPGYTLVETFDIGIKHTENIYIQRGGLNFTPSVINIEIDEALIDSMNLAAGTTYKLMPQECYTIDNPTINVDTEDRLLVGSVTVDPTKLMELNGGQYGTLDYVIPIRVSTEGMELVPDRNTLILGFNVNEAAITVSNPSAEELNLESTDAFKFSVEVPFESMWNILVKSEVDAAYVDVFNEQNGTFYSLLPEDCYTTTGQTELVQGASLAEIEYTLNKENILPGNYILPLKISAIEADVDLDYDKDVRKVFIISKAGEELDRSTWTIAYVSSEETVGEGTANGRAIFMIDDNTATYWHSQWMPSETPPPYNIVIDCQRSITPSMLKMLLRNNGSNRLKLVRFYMADSVTSTSGITESDWNFIGEFSCNTSSDYFTYAVKSVTGRYLRVEVPDSGENGSVAAICDLKVLGSVE